MFGVLESSLTVKMFNYTGFDETSPILINPQLSIIAIVYNENDNQGEILSMSNLPII